MRRATLIYNPKSGRQVGRRRAPAVIERLHRGDFEVTPRPTTGPGDGTRLAAEAAAAGDEVVFALGGDGTLREVAKGLLGTSTALGPLPGGTTNVVVRALGIPQHPLRAAERLATGTVRPLDVGRVAGEPFLMLVSGGLDAAVMARQNSTAKRYFGKAALGWVVFQEWLRHRFPEVTLHTAGGEARCQTFAVCNLPLYAGSFRLAPEADPRDGLLDVMVFEGRGRWALGRFLIDMALGRHARRRDVSFETVKAVELRFEGSMPLQIDGDVLQVESPVTVELVSQALQVLVPSP